ncbi:hypothetical protein [Pseudomonas edaphica]|uniref:hypothetical protein n=1 Tax=Pseudomonas edaphica TaxID=2006980 RepID=UPI003D0FEFAB
MESSPQLLRAGIATFFLLLSIALSVARMAKPTKILGKWQSTALSAMLGMGAGFSVILIWSFCVARGYPSRLDIYALVASVTNGTFYTAAFMTASLRSLSAIREKRGA